jgi:hypothetical protein
MARKLTATVATEAEVGQMRRKSATKTRWRKRYIFRGVNHKSKRKKNGRRSTPSKNVTKKPGEIANHTDCWQEIHRDEDGDLLKSRWWR